MVFASSTVKMRGKMKIEWVITDNDLCNYKKFIKAHENKKIVLSRRKNLNPELIEEIDAQAFWRAFLMGILTSQQRSGEGSGADALLDSKESILHWDFCKKNKENLAQVSAPILKKYSIRYPNKKLDYLQSGAEYLDKEWPSLSLMLNSLRCQKTGKKEEREVVLQLQALKGIGPKQSRNIIQYLGLSRYEIPLDSRIMKRLKELGFPVPLSSSALGNEEYYCFVEDGLREVLSRINVLPCMFDACAFASFEKS